MKYQYHRHRRHDQCVAGNDKLNIESTNKNVNYFKKIIKPTDEEIKKHSEYLKQNLKKNFF